MNCQCHVSCEVRVMFPAEIVGSVWLEAVFMAWSAAQDHMPYAICLSFTHSDSSLEPLVTWQWKSQSEDCISGRFGSVSFNWHCHMPHVTLLRSDIWVLSSRTMSEKARLRSSHFVQSLVKHFKLANMWQVRNMCHGDSWQLSCLSMIFLDQVDTWGVTVTCHMIPTHDTCHVTCRVTCHISYNCHREWTSTISHRVLKRSWRTRGLTPPCARRRCSIALGAFVTVFGLCLRAWTWLNSGSACGCLCRSLTPLIICHVSCVMFESCVMCHLLNPLDLRHFICFIWQIKRLLWIWCVLAALWTSEPAHAHNSLNVFEFSPCQGLPSRELIQLTSLATFWRVLRMHSDRLLE